MADHTDDEFEESQAAYAPMLEATASILPWVGKAKTPRFDPRLNERWIAAAQQIAADWSARQACGLDGLRSRIFGLYAVAVETADSDCLQLAEALANTADRLEDSEVSPRLIAALSATTEALADPAGLEQENFAERAAYFARRLGNAASEDSPRSAVIDQLFVEEAREQIEQMQDALAVLPPDAYALKSEAERMAQQAEHIELWGIMHIARRLAGHVTAYASDLESQAGRSAVEQTLAELIEAVAAVDA